MEEVLAQVGATTFGAGVEGGEAVRKTYARLGFVPAEMAPLGPDGRERQVYRRWMR